MQDETIPTYPNRDLDQKIGSLLEGWLMRDTLPRQCRFCNGELDDTDNDYCSEECQESWQQVFDARQEIGQRDMQQRGFD